MAIYSRQGSFLLLCIGMMSLMIIIGFAILLNIQTQTDASTNNQRTMLAQSAALTGLEHATEQILTDYASKNSQVASDVSGATALVNVRGLTHLDSPYRTTFLAIDSPDIPDQDQNAPDVDKDIRPEHSLVEPYIVNWNDTNYWSWCGFSHVVGRGRYYEPNFYNVKPGALGLPDPFPFVQAPNAPPPSLPDRHDGVFYDEDFRRITTGGPIAARAASRYRLRYGVNVIDLSGCLLSNYTDDMASPTEYQSPPLWAMRAGDAFFSMVQAQSGAADIDSYAAARLEHVFLGRGFSGNVDLAKDGCPVTFPLMYRLPGGQDMPWDWFENPWSNPQYLANTLYQSDKVSGSPNGGEPLYVANNNTNDPYIHALIGPQMSWWNSYYAAKQNNTDAVGGGSNITPNQAFLATTPFGRGVHRPIGYPDAYTPTNRKWYEGRVDTPFYINLMTAPPWVINAMLFAYLPPNFKSSVQATIWFIQWTGQDKDGNNQYAWIESKPLPAAQNTIILGGRDLLVDTTSQAFAEFPAPTRPAPVIKPDYHIPDPRTQGTPDMSGPLDSAGNRTQAKDANGNLLWTVFPYEEVYPGLAWNGNPAYPNQGDDSAGAQIATNSLPWAYGRCNHTWQPFFRMNPPQTWFNASNGAGGLTVTPPAWWLGDPRNLAMKTPSYDGTLDSNTRLYQDSYWWDIFSAFSMAVTVVRASYQTGANGYWDPTQIFPSGMKDPTRFQTLRDVDRLFLAYLGESLDNPGKNEPKDVAAFQFDMGPDPVHHPNFQAPYLIPYIPTTNIRTLLAAQQLQVGKNPPMQGMSNQDRAATMERVVNDFRMAFLGSSPDYSDPIDPISHQVDPALEFRPLDLDGDGVAHCSCYQDPNALYPNVVHNPSSPAPDGRGRKPDGGMYFSPSGCFFMGKSHYYRVITRGEVWDNRLSQIASEATLESVLAVDPEERDVRETQTLFQRWHFDRYQGMMPHVRQ